MENHSIFDTNIKENDISVIEESTMEHNHEPSSHVVFTVTDKLVLPVLDETLIHPVIEKVQSISSLLEETPHLPTATAPSDMVTMVVKDFNYCQEEFLKQVKENNLDVNVESIMRLLRIAMVVVEQTNQPGTKKKEFVTNLLREIVTKTDGISPEHKREALNMITGNIVSDSIDFLIDASKGKFNINKVEEIAQEVAKSCFTLCFERFSKKR